ncbi:ATP-binding cassette domain-containing protein [uncultured Secundilactobacillus sp.]|uniref:ABC transporter ATP-binding protein n=1 Tax=uncultured Secundilactobacillus sp. TaxID=2813935 RepID=UPI002585B888|nr:ATP-binding cassette domain-containing protein [uncultured Secundilactobacillus sp.]
MALIELHHMGVTRGGQEILRDVNMMVDKGEMVTITGPSGGGKSTLVRVIASLMSETSGEVRYDGKQVAEYDPVMYRRRVSYSMQQPTLFGDSVRDNLAFPYDIRKVTFDEKRAIEGLEAVKLPGDYLDKPVDELSGGERQRVALLRNVMFHPETLILDEVTAGLDSANKDVVHDIIKMFNETDHITILMVTHDQEEITAANRLLQVEAGRIISGGELV